MPEEINRAVADLWCSRAPAHEEASPEFGFEFDGIRAIELLGFLEFLQLEARAWRWRTWAVGREETCGFVYGKGRDISVLEKLRGRN